MHESTVETRGRWVTAGVAGAIVTIFLLFLFRFPSPTVPLAPVKPESILQASVQLARPDESDLVLKAEADLRDLRPLFLPTERNAALPDPRLEPGRTVLETDNLQPVFSDAQARLTERLPPAATLAGKRISEATPADAVSATETALSLEGFGRKPQAINAFELRSGFMEVTNLNDGRRILGEELPAEARVPIDKAWGPVEYMAVVDAAGLVSPLVVTEGSRVEEVDVHFRRYLETKYRLGARLAPGFYRVVVAP